MKPGHNKAKATISTKVFISLPSEKVKTQQTNFILDENSGMSAYELEISCNVSVYFSLGLSGLTTDCISEGPVTAQAQRLLFLQVSLLI